MSAHVSTRFAAVTVLDRDGRPHTTPVAAVCHGGRWWFTTSRRAAKVRFLRDRPVATIAVANATGWLTTTGPAAVLDISDPGSLLRHAAHVVDAGPASLRLAGAYARDVAGYLTHLGDIPGAWAPHERVLVAVDPEFVEHSVPPDRRPTDAVACIVGASDGRRPMSLPGWFDGDAVGVGAPARPIDPTAGVAVMSDNALLDDDPGRPTDQQGLLVRADLDEDPDRRDGVWGVVARSMTTWRGFDTTTRRFRANAA
ncbi:MAG: pyridoxamine 5'-phosphate oxidase family protein [Ilumatobacter sp.]|nr:pyridoxamine 5'-phosphate oxidase family protein [Ilumatobacter sp.]